MKKFILINSPIFWDSTKENEQYLSPLGLGYIATYLEKINDIDVEIVDCVKDRKSVQDIISYIDKTKPDFVGINIFTQNYELVKNIVESIHVNCKCFIGGQAVKSIYRKILNWNVSNTLNIIIGEGEFIIPQIVSENCSQEPEEQMDSKYVYRVNINSIYFPGTFRTSVFQFRPYDGTQLYNEIIQDTGIIQNCQFNETISKFKGRSQFNFDFGNYSMESDEVLNEYILKTQRLAGE